MSIVTHKHGVVTFKDETGTPIEAVLGATGTGLSYSGVEAGNVEAVPIYSRGSFVECVDGDDKQITGSITIFHDGDLTDATNKLGLDATRKTGAFTSGVSADPGLVTWTTNIVLVSTRSGLVHTTTFSNCRVSADYSEAKDGNKITFNFTCFQGVTITSA